MRSWRWPGRQDDGERDPGEAGPGDAAAHADEHAHHGRDGDGRHPWDAPPGAGEPAVDHPADDAAGEPADPEAERTLPRIGFIGAGRVGVALGVAFLRAGWPVTVVASRDPERRRRFREAVPTSRAVEAARLVPDWCDLVFVTVPDDAIGGVAAGLRLYSGQAIAHTSGLLPAAALRPALAAGTEAGSFHPLVAFAETESAVQALHGATIAIEGDAALQPLLADLARAVGAEPVRIEPEGKAAYHAAAVLAAGGFVALLDAIAELGRGAGLDEPGALAIYAPLVRQALAGAERLGIAAALTGPVVRGDAGTLRAHFEAMRRLAPGAVDLYAAAARREVALARERGDLDAAHADVLLGIITSGA